MRRLTLLALVLSAAPALSQTVVRTDTGTPVTPPVLVRPVQGVTEADYLLGWINVTRAAYRLPRGIL